MDPDGERNRTEGLLKDLKTRAYRSFGQNFLVDTRIADRIVFEVPEEHLNNILEIGPGLGVLTERLLERGANVLAVEKDKVLAGYLEESLKCENGGRLEILNEDALEILDDLIGRGSFVVSNLPFNISSRFTGGLIDRIGFDRKVDRSFPGAIIMYQLEFANRMISPKGSKEYGRLSVMFRSKMDHRCIMDVPKGSFHPVPRVDGKVIGFQPKKQYEVKPVDEELFSKLVNVVFLNRRKKMKNSVNPRSFGLELDMKDITWILEDMDLADRRPEELSPEIFIDLSNRLARLL